MTRPSSLNFNVCVFIVRLMHRFMRRYRKTGLTILAVFAVQLVVMSFCAIPSVHAASVTTDEAISMDMAAAMQCTKDMSMPAGQDMPEDAHCNTSDFSTFSNQANDVPATWTLIAVLPPLLNQTDLISGQEQQPLFSVSEATPRSASLIYQTSLRIRL